MALSGNRNIRGKRILCDVVLLLWPLAALRFGYFLLVTPLLPHGDTVPYFSLGYFLAHFLFLGLLVLGILWTFHQDCRGKRLWLLLPPLLFLFLLSFPAGYWDTLPFLVKFFQWKLWYNEDIHHILFFAYFFCFVKGGVATVKSKRSGWK